MLLGNKPLLISAACIDAPNYVTSCPVWTERGYCTKDYVTFMKKNCQKSCGFCGGGKYSL